MAAELLTTETVGAYVASLNLDGMAGDLEAEEIQGGNLNYAWRVKAKELSVFVKQAPEFIKCLGPSFGLPSARISYETLALAELHAVSPSHAPRLIHFDESRGVAVLEDLVGFVLLRDELVAGRISEHIASDLGRFLAAVRAATAGREQAVVDKLGGDNNSLMRGITRDYVFTKPFVDDPTNRELSGVLATKADALRKDASFLAAVKDAGDVFDAHRDCLCHGDLHAGSVMTDGTRAVAIDAEFAFFGPSSFDVALLVAGYVFAFAAATAWTTPDKAALRRAHAKAAIRAVWEACSDGTAPALPEAAKLAACELLRRVLGAASVPDLSDIHVPSDRVKAELLVLEIGAKFLHQPPTAIDDLLADLEDAFDAVAFSVGNS